MSTSWENTSPPSEREGAEPPELTDEVDENSGTEGSAALHGAEDPRSFRLEYPDEYLEPMSRARSVEKFQDPRTNVEVVNPEFDADVDIDNPYNVNCADCARSFEATWRGQEQEAAGRAYQIGDSGSLEVDGERSERTEQWAHEEFVPTEAADLRATLEAAGHGSSAIVHSSWEGPMRGGHAYNVVNYGGEVLTVESQEGTVLDYSNDAIHPALEAATDVSHRAMAWDAEGKRIL